MLAISQLNSGPVLTGLQKVPLCLRVSDANTYPVLLLAVLLDRLLLGVLGDGALMGRTAAGARQTVQTRHAV